MPYITHALGLTIKSPTDGTTNYGQTLRDDTWDIISSHDHTGGGSGAQIGASAIANNNFLCAFISSPFCK